MDPKVKNVHLKKNPKKTYDNIATFWNDTAPKVSTFHVQRKKKSKANQKLKPVISKGTAAGGGDDTYIITSH